MDNVNGADQAEDSCSSFDGNDDMPTLEAIICKIFKEGKKSIGGEVEVDEERSAQPKDSSPR